MVTLLFSATHSSGMIEGLPGTEVKTKAIKYHRTNTKYNNKSHWSLSKETVKLEQNLKIPQTSNG